MNPKNKKILYSYIAFMMGFPFVMLIYWLSGYGYEVATFIYIAVLLGVPVYYIYQRYTRLQREGISAVATITEILKTTDFEGEASYRYCYEFTVQGKVYTIKTPMPDSVQKYKIGDKVNILYMPDAPQRAEIEKDVDKIEPFWRAYFWILLGGIMLLIFAGIVLIHSRYVLWGTTWIFSGAAIGMPIGYFFWGLLRLRLRGKFTTATVTRYTQHVDSDNGKLSYCPYFEFYTGGNTYTVQSHVAYTYMKHQIGDKVNIRYLPNDPESADIDNNFMLGLMFVLTCICFLAMVVGVLFFVFHAESFREVYSKVSDLFF